MIGRPRNHLVIGVFFGLLTALVEVIFILVNWEVLHQFVWTGTNALWMVPLYYLCLFSAIGALGVVGADMRRQGMSLGITAGLAAALMAMTLLFLVLGYRLALIARLLLAAGVGVQVGRWAHRHQRRIFRMAGVGAPVLLMLLAITAIGYRMVEQSRARGPEDVATALASDAPNILLIILDTVRAASLGLYGYEHPTTPDLERWATQGVVFDRAIATSSWTLPSHASMFTGRPADALSTDWLVPLDDSVPTLAALLQRHGWRTGGFTANLYYTSRESGLARGFNHYEDYRTTIQQFRISTALGQMLISGTRVRRDNDPKPGEMITAQFLAWSADSATQPWFAFLNYFDSHEPYHAPEPWRSQFKADTRRINLYNASLAFLDNQVDTILTVLRARGELENTIVVLVADHGELHGEHGLMHHGNSLYDLLIHVPLVIWYPGSVPGGRRIGTTVSTRDIPATILDLAGIRDPALPGSSLRPLWGANPEGWRGSLAISEVREGINTPPTDPVSLGEMHSLVEDSLHLILNGDGTVDLYNLAADSAEETNLASLPGWSATIAGLRRTLDSRINPGRGAEEFRAR